MTDPVIDDFPSLFVEKKITDQLNHMNTNNMLTNKQELISKV